MPSKVIEKVQKAGMGRVWLQVDGQAEPFLYGGCYGIGDATVPEGDLTPIFCPSPTTPEKWDIVDFIKGTPGNPTGSLEAPLDLTNYLLKLACPFGLQYRITECGVPEDANSWETMLHFKGTRITSRAVTAMNPRLPDNNNVILTTADITFEKLTFVKRMEFVAVASGAGATGHLQAISFCDEPSCPGNCGVGSDGCQVGYVVTAGIVAGEQIRKTLDGGATWTAITSPFTSVYDNIVDVACKGDIVIVVNGTTAGQIARSQDGGVSWSVVSLPDAEIATSVFMLDSSRVWVTGEDGFIWYSSDGGLTWVTQADGDATTEDLNDLFMYDSKHGWAVGDAGAIVATDDGETWTAQTSGTANQLNTVHFITRFIGYAAGNSGTVLKTVDGGETWTAQTWFGAGTDTINSITSCEESFVFFGGTTSGAAGFIYQSVDGGATASSLTLPTNSGVNELFCCAPDKVYGAAQAGVVLVGE